MENYKKYVIRSLVSAITFFVLYMLLSLLSGDHEDWIEVLLNSLIIGLVWTVIDDYLHKYILKDKTNKE